MDLTDIRTERDTPYLNQPVREHFVYCVVYTCYVSSYNAYITAKIYGMRKGGYSDDIICATFGISESSNVELSMGVFIIILFLS